LVAALDSPTVGSGIRPSDCWSSGTIFRLHLSWRRWRAAAFGPEARLHALCALDGLGALKPNIVLSELKDMHPGVRRHAVRLSGAVSEPNRGGRSGLLPLVADPDAQVRMQMAYTLGEWDDPHGGDALGKLLVSTTAIGIGGCGVEFA